MENLRITHDVTIPGWEIELRFARAGGPGGQKVNTAATKVELRFDVERSAALTDEHKARIRERLGSRLTASGLLILQASEHRTQADNRRAVLARFRHLLRHALRVPTPRRPTRPTAASVERRLQAKRRRGETKGLRRPPELP